MLATWVKTLLSVKLVKEISILVIDVSIANLITQVSLKVSYIMFNNWNQLEYSKRQMKAKLTTNWFLASRFILQNYKTTKLKLSTSVNVIIIFPRHKEPHFKTTFNPRLSRTTWSRQNFKNHYVNFTFQFCRFCLFIFSIRGF